MKGINVNLDPDTVKRLLPNDNVLPNKNIWDSFLKPKSVSPLVRDLLPTINKIQMNWIQLKMAFIDGKELSSSDDVVNEYAAYLQYPNDEIAALAKSIVAPGDSDDVKAWKIVVWVQENITYKSDIKNYGKMEWWALPTETVERKSGDCEDGAFLIHSLMLNSGIPWDRIRTYAGEVVVGQGASSGGHGWTAYKRETDDEWVVLDWCYYPNQKQISDRTPMKEDYKYIDDWFYIDAHKTTETPYANKVRNPGAMAYDWSHCKKFIPGQKVNLLA